MRFRCTSNWNTTSTFIKSPILIRQRAMIDYVGALFVSDCMSDKLQLVVDLGERSPEPAIGVAT